MYIDFFGNFNFEGGFMQKYIAAIDEFKKIYNGISGTLNPENGYTVYILNTIAPVHRLSD